MSAPLAPSAFAAVAVFAATALASPSAQAQVIDLSTIKPTCPGPFGYKEPPKPPEPPVAGKCEIDTTKLAALTTEAECSGAWLKFDDKATPKCSVVKAPPPSCGNALPDLVVKDNKCVVERSTPRSSLGDFLGDCFYVSAVPQGTAFPFKGGTYLKVLSDKEAPGGKDKLLNVASAEGRIPVYSCKATPGAPVVEMAASDLAAIGANRYGWAYGVLAMPYKYYKGAKKIGDGVTIGPYVGWRQGEPGAGTTFALSIGLSKVKGEVRDAQDKITSTPDLAAISAAAGVMWDIRKSTGVTKPFTIGLFVGTDRVSADNVVKFPNNGKGWVALQIGYDFTDN